MFKMYKSLCKLESCSLLELHFIAQNMLYCLASVQKELEQYEIANSYYTTCFLPYLKAKYEPALCVREFLANKSFKSLTVNKEIAESKVFRDYLVNFISNFGNNFSLVEFISALGLDQTTIPSTE